jgi:isopentenyl diphosphate isomerase/L-lactate dehydrogenase-like FMN-dependent dehydrogenase
VRWAFLNSKPGETIAFHYTQAQRIRCALYTLILRSLLPPRVVNIDDLRRLARKRVPRAIFDYIDGGSDAEITLRANVRSFEEVVFHPHNACAPATCDLRTTVLGQELAFPLVLAPLGFTRLFHPEGERGAARAAGAAGIAFCLSSFSGYRIEEIRQTSPGVLWYQLYLAGGREVVEATLERAQKAGFSALAVTIDTNTPGQRERDFRNGVPQLLSGGVFDKLPFLPALMSRPRWLARFLLDREVMRFPNIVTKDGPMGVTDVREMLQRSTMSWADLKWIRQAWRGPILMKGVITGEDARRSLDEGAAGVIVSNHGGRQLDGCSATLRALPEVVEAVNGRAEVLMDGGIRRGSDILKAICLGAKAVLAGRAYAYGLAAAGSAGASRAVDILRSGAERTLTLLGCSSVSELDRSFVRIPTAWGGRDS